MFLLLYCKHVSQLWLLVYIMCNILNDTTPAVPLGSIEIMRRAPFPTHCIIQSHCIRESIFTFACIRFHRNVYF